MTVKNLIDTIGLTPVALPSPDREVHGAYIGDLLSWVMGRANEDNVWITIISNSNIVAVATLADVSCIILAEGVAPDTGVTETAEAKGINILSSDKSAYEIAKTLAEIGI